MPFPNRRACVLTVSLVVVLALALAPRPAVGRPALEEGDASLAAFADRLGLSGFLEAHATDRRSDANAVSLGDLEVDLAKELDRNVQVGAAVVLNREGAAVTVAFIDVHLFGGLVAPRGRLPVERGLHVQAGRFDVPFGNDFRSFAAKDRTEVSAPLTTGELMDGGANDVGVRVLGADGAFNYSVFLVRGEGSGGAVGGRLGFTPFDEPFRLRPRPCPFEAAVSLIHDVDARGAARKVSIALDSEVRSGPLRLRAEWVRTDARLTERLPERAVRSGWHVTAAVDAGTVAGIPLVPYARYEALTGDLPAAGETAEAGPRARRTERLTAGLNTRPLERLTLKAELRCVLAAAPEAVAKEAPCRSSWVVQAVVTF